MWIWIVRGFKTQTVCKRTVMANMLSAASYLHNFCIDSNYAWADSQTNLFDDSNRSLIHASNAHAAELDVNGGATAPAAEDDEEDTNSVALREKLAFEGWRRYQTALKQKEAFVVHGE
eukprot:TRINITY_DN9752_c0_g1_i1.p3 TRINITY_DN9752_c0_g1~~TRINITY_DN9752_c0_g1_i1.p3  ORF type:complete len:118 (+),score=19.66 TRINITY_DN9752_c0_g1_i1:1851-2204(+)